MQPAPIPPMGMATCVVRSPWNARCGPGLSNSSWEYGPRVAALEGSEADGTDACGRGTAALSAAEEVVTRNSLRVGLPECGISTPPKAGNHPILILPIQMKLHGDTGA